MKCEAMTARMNCGCCEDTMLGCDYDANHVGLHREVREEIDGRTTKKYEVYWQEIS